MCDVWWIVLSVLCTNSYASVIKCTGTLLKHIATIFDSSVYTNNEPPAWFLSVARHQIHRIQYGSPLEALPKLPAMCYSILWQHSCIIFAQRSKITLSVDILFIVHPGLLFCLSRNVTSLYVAFCLMKGEISWTELDSSPCISWKNVHCFEINVVIWFSTFWLKPVCLV